MKSLVSVSLGEIMQSRETGRAVRPGLATLEAAAAAGRARGGVEQGGGMTAHPRRSTHVLGLPSGLVRTSEETCWLAQRRPTRRDLRL